MGEFKGMVAGVTYSDRAEFEKAARDAGHRLGQNRTGDWRVGMPVSVRFDDGTVVLGQVWAKGAQKGCGWVWVALDNGRYARVYTSSGRAEETDALGTVAGGRVGKVAA